MREAADDRTAISLNGSRVTRLIDSLHRPLGSSAAGDRPLVTGRGPVRGGRLVSRISLHMRVVRSALRAWPRSARSTPRPALAAPGVVAVWTAAGRRRHPADRFPADPRRGARALSPAASWRATACAMSASRSRWCSPKMPISPRTPPIWSQSRSRSCRPLLRCRRAAAATSSPGRSTEPAVIAQGYGDVEAAFRAAHAVVELDLAIGRHSGVPLETRGAIGALRRRRATCWSCTAPPRCRTGTATRSPACSAASPPSVHLYEGHVGGGFGIRGELYPEDVLVCARGAAARPAGQMDRGPARASDRRQSFAPAAPSRARRGRRRRAHPRDRRRVLPRPGRLCPHPRRDRAGSRPPPCCPARTACRPIARSGISG